MKIGSIKPEVIALREFFKEESSSLQIPSIQRQFVWDAEDIKELIDSIVSGYHIGAIIIWEPTTKFPGAPLIGSSYKSSDLRYVLDGQQRLTALMLIQNGWELVRGMKKITTTPISYVPENGKLYLSSRKGIDVALIVNATLGDVESLTKLQRLYPAGYRKAMDGVGEKIVNYRLPFYVLKSDTRGGGDEIYEKIAEIFTRVNSAGVKIGNLEMFLSFFAAAFPKEAKEKIVVMYEELSDGFELDLEPLVRFIFSKMGMTQNQITKVASFRRSIQELKEGYSKERHKIGEVLAQAQKSIRVVVDLLDKELGLSTTQYVPSQSVLLPLFEYVYEKGYESVNKIGGKERNRLLKWFLIASFNGIYSSSPNHKIESDLEIIRSNGKNFPLEKLLSAMKDRTPHRTTIEKADVIGAYTNVLRGRAGKEYLMLLDILLYRNKATDWAGRMIKSEDAAVHHIFPRELLKENEETREDMINCLGNLTFISPSVNSEIGDESPDKYLPQYQEDILSQHLIPANRRYWKVENFQEFLDARLKLIWQGTRNLLEELD
jgi:hypothetical protein